MNDFASRIRSRALQGRNKYLRSAPQLEITRTVVLLSRIAALVEPRSRRGELPLQYRHPPKSRPPVLDEREYADALTESNLKLSDLLDENNTYAANSLRNHKPGSELGSGDDSD